MSKPREAYEFPLHGAICELISGSSALHMNPDPIPPELIPEGHGYLSDVDYMVQHAVEHLHQAIQLINQGTKKIDIFYRRVWRNAAKLADGPIEGEARKLVGEILAACDEYAGLQPGGEWEGA